MQSAAHAPAPLAPCGKVIGQPELFAAKRLSAGCARSGGCARARPWAVTAAVRYLVEKLSTGSKDALSRFYCRLSAWGVYGECRPTAPAPQASLTRSPSVCIPASKSQDAPIPRRQHASLGGLSAEQRGLSGGGGSLRCCHVATLCTPAGGMENGLGPIQ